MRNFHVVLPTFAPDYSGVASVLYELGGTVVIHDPGGCIGNFIAYDEPRAYNGHSRVFTSELDDMQALLGLDDALIDAACQAQQMVGGSFVSIVGTPNPMVLGTDYRAIAREVGRRCGVPALSFDTTGTAYYEKGVAQALLEVARMLFSDGGRRNTGRTGRPRSVNLLGATPLDLIGQHNVDEARRILEAAGWQVVSCWAMGSPLEELGRAPEAGVNVVLSTCGVPLARWMEQEFGIPYARGFLSGQRAAEEFLSLLERIATEGETPPSENPETEDGHPRGDGSPGHGGHETGKSALVVADQVMGGSMRRALELDCGFARVDVATFFSGSESWARAGDAIGIDEARLSALIRAGGYDLVVGDPLLSGFAAIGAPDTTHPLLAAIPHVAVSSRIAWNSPACPYGTGFLTCVEEARPLPVPAADGFGEDRPGDGAATRPQWQPVDDPCTLVGIGEPSTRRR